MRKTQKKEAEDFIEILSRAHGAVKKAIRSGKNDIAMDILVQCQDGAIKLGDLLEKAEGEDCEIIRTLENYCELIYQIYEKVRLSQEKGSSTKRQVEKLNQILSQIKNDVHEIKERTEAVFLPYNASMWDSLESVWKAAEEDPDCDAYVIPIPYYDKNPDGSFREVHYEGDLFPDYVPITHYNDYDFEGRRPDMIFIHNPYDEYNHVTSVHPFFYSKNLKKYTAKLVYIPYYVLAEPDPENETTVEGIQIFCKVPGVFYADKVIVQSEAMRQVYIKVLTKETGEESRKIWEEKILGLGSPKMDKVVSTRKEELKIPEEWLKIIEKPDGSWKKIIFYNTSVAALIQHEDKMLEKMKHVFRTFKENRDEVALLWRPHPLIRATIESMRPELWEKYRKLVEQYGEESWGIYDDSPDMDRAVALCDGYYGDASSIVQLCQEAGKPVMLQDTEILKSTRHEYDIASAEAICNYQGNYYFVYMCEPLLCRMNRKTLECELLYRFCEGEMTERLYKKIIPYKNRLFLVPFLSEQIGVYDIVTAEMRFIQLNEDYVDVRWQQRLVSAKFENALVKGKFLYMIPHSYHAIIRIDMECLEIEEIPLGRKGTGAFCYCIGSACFRENRIVFPVYSEGSICIYHIDKNEIDIVYPTGNKKIYSNILNVGDKLWLIPKKLYEGIDIWDMEREIIERTLVFLDEISILSQENEMTDIRDGFLIGHKLYLLPSGLGCGVSVDIDSGKANIWNLPNEYEKEEFSTNQQYLYQLRYSAVLLEDKKAVICRLRGEWLECENNEVCMVERHSIREKKLIMELSIKDIGEVLLEYNMDLEDFIKIEKENRNRKREYGIGKNIYEYIGK